MLADADEKAELETAKVEHDMLGRRDVLDELSISFEQAVFLRRRIPRELTTERLRKARLADPPLPTPEMDRILLEVKRDQVNAMKDGLDQQQTERLSQLRWQYKALEGFGAALDEAVELTDEQKKQIEEKERELGEELRERMWAFHHQSQRALHDVLTPEQRAAWQKRVGSRFSFKSPWTGLSINRALR
ncbi:MAG: hypothetical protein H8E66_27830 [Planctomycetes bacterium]|nr:hypothetical protein [Planctomycetota bacterium]